MVLSIGERIIRFLFSPSRTFGNSKEDTIGDALTYFVVILGIFAAFIATIGKKVVTERGDAEAVYKVAKNKNPLMMLNFQLTLHGHLKSCLLYTSDAADE